MDNETKKALGETAKEMDRQAGELDSLKKSSENMKNRLDSLEGKLGTLEDSRQTPASEDTSQTDKPDEEKAALGDKVVGLEKRVAYLEGPDHENEIIQKFLTGMDKDNFTAIGLKLGYLEEVEATAEDIANFEGAEPVEVPLGEGRTLRVSKKKPDDPTGWEYSQTQDLYVKIE